MMMERLNVSMTGERDDALPADDRERLTAAIVHSSMPDYGAVRALAVLSDDDRIGRFTAMGRHFVADVRRRVRAAGAQAVLDEPPSVHERVLETATRQIVLGGPRGLTMASVVREAGVPRRSLYNLYATNGALVDACRRRAQTLWRARFE
jgi:hypothetical protein